MAAMVNSHVTDGTLAADLGRLLESGQGADITIMTDGFQLTAHKLLLMARSPVFAAILRHDTQGPTETTVSILDVKDVVLQQLLLFIYTDKVPLLESLAPQLLPAADNYGLPYLKRKCEEQLLADLCVDNAATYALLSVIYSCSKLRANAFSFVIAHRAQVMGTSSWQDVMRSQTEAAFEICCLVAALTPETRLTEFADENYSVSSEETDFKADVHEVLEIEVERSPHSAPAGTQPYDFISQEDNSICIRDSYTLAENDFHDFSCSSCSQKFSSKYELIMHVFLHIDGVQSPSFVCRLCGEVFLTDDNLNEHLRMKENYQNQSTLTTHALAGTCESYKCGNMEIYQGPCSSSREQATNVHPTSVVESWKRDYHSHEEITSYPNSSLPHANSHDDVMHSTWRQLKWEAGDKPFTSTGNLRNHSVIHARGRLYNCRICDKTFKDNRSLKKHSLIHSGEKHHKCDICGKSFTQADYLKKHTISHTGVGPYKCDICGKTFARNRRLKNHSVTHTGLRPYQCEICGKSFALCDSMKAHTKTHTRERRVKCDICKKSFSQKYALKVHKVIHTGERKYQCEVCGKSFPQSGYLKTHARIHTGERLYKCDACGKSFTFASALKNHTLIHNGQKPYKCDVCSKSFTQIGNLKAHKVMHTGARPYKCDICGKAFKHRSHVIRHSLIHTGKI